MPLVAKFLPVSMEEFCFQGEEFTSDINKCEFESELNYYSAKKCNDFKIYQISYQNIISKSLRSFFYSSSE